MPAIVIMEVGFIEGTQPKVRNKLENFVGVQGIEVVEGGAVGGGLSIWVCGWQR